jgi:Cys-tRNA(Pro)/Cys-tRNA(Cys) deacylase
MRILALTAALGASTCWAGKRDGRPSKLLSSNSGKTPRRSDITMSRTTRATLALAKLGVKFRLHAYDYDPNADRIGLQAAEALGIEPRRMLKTLMAEVDGKPVCAVVPSDREVSMKKLAAAFAGKAAGMMRPADAERLTGYHVGGISPFAPKKRVPVAIDRAALAETSVFLNGGQRGLQIELDPNDAVRALDATVQALTG